jgi:2-dehydropantoate 2-reductase
MSEQRIAVLGTGANGASIGADMVRAGHDVTFVEQWPAHVEAMREHGLRVEMPEETTTTEVRTMHLCELATLRDPFDLVFVGMKAYDTRWACELIKPHVKQDGIVVGLQNGMSIDDMTDVLGPERTMGAVVECSSAMFTPGVAERHTPPSRSWFAVGGLSPTTRARAEEVAAVLRAAGTVEVSDDIRSAKWMKLMVNAGELVPTAIVDLPMREASNLPGMHEVSMRAGLEALETAVALGNAVVPIFGLTGLDLTDLEGFVAATLGAVYADFALPHSRTTVLHDWMKGRHSEVDEINGLVVREQERLGGSAPVNARIVDIARRIERGELAPDPANLDLLVGSRV